MHGRKRWVAAAAAVALVVLVGGLGYYFVTVTPASMPASQPVGTASCPASESGPAAADWPTYHADGQRTGTVASGPVTAARPAWPLAPTLDGQIYAEPLVCGTTVYVATENDSVYAINAASGATLWRTHLGTPVPASSLPCGDIDPSGITGTPVIDGASGTLYAVAFVAPAQHLLFGLDVQNGAVRARIVVDPSGSDPTAEQQRGALALADGHVYVPFGGLYGDCGAYHGWVVGVPLAASGPLLAYEVPTHREGGLWASGGIAVGPDGNLYVTSGNGDSGTTFDFGDSVLELSPSLSLLGYFAPTDWAALNTGDTDLGSLSPTVLPDGTIFQVGKAGVGYLLRQNALGGIGDGVANRASAAEGPTGERRMSAFRSSSRAPTDSSTSRRTPPALRSLGPTGGSTRARRSSPGTSSGWSR